MPDDQLIHTRKADHLRINLENDVQSGLTTGLEHYRFNHRALPELNLEEIDLTQSIFKRTLAVPLLISSMTGGTPEAARINQVLATAAQEMHIAMGVGSQRAAIEHPETAVTFQVRRFAPDILLFANLGAIQLNYSFGVDQCQLAVESIGADALVLHFNALQEAVQPEGNSRFAGLARQVASVCRALPVPVIAKEVGWGFSIEDVRLLVDAGVSAIDVAGAGGTSWSQVEMHRAKTESQRRLAGAFINWGIPTSQAILNVRQVSATLPVIASGGLRSGVEIAKCIALGACLGGMAGPFLKSASRSLEETLQVIGEIRSEMQVCLFAAGVGNLKQLGQTPLVYIE